MSKLNGGIIGPDNVPTGAFGSASGVWSLSDVTNYKKQGTWPVPLTGHQVANSCRFNDGSSDYLNRTPSSQGNLQISTFSFWVKRSSLGEQIILCTGDPDVAGSLFEIYFDGGDRLHIETASPSLVTNRLFRDLSAWYHIVVAVDTTQSTSSNRVKIYVNGVQETSFQTEQYPTQNANLNFNKTVAHYIGVLLPPTYTAYYDGYMAEFVSVDGQQLAPTSFGETDSVTNNWVPKDVSGLTFGTNGFYLDFKDSSALGNDAAGSNNFTANNLTSIDQSVDTCTNNFATLNSLTQKSTSFTIINGNLETNGVSSNGWRGMISTIAVSSGKWYFETKVNQTETSDPMNIAFGIVDIDQFSQTADQEFYYTSRGYGYHGNQGKKGNNNNLVNYGNSYTVGDIIGCAFDLDNNKIYFSKNGTFQNSGDPTSGSSGTGSAFDITDGYTYTPSFSSYFNNDRISFNFGSPPYSISSGNVDSSGMGNFEYAVPSGYYSLCTRNLNLIG
jgi:hypothetical protein